jgi:glycosyltransferase involved in cell wall biosynthesis
MRIVHVNPYFYPFRGGIEHRVHNVCRLLGQENEVSIVTGRLPGTEREEKGDGYDILRLDSRFIGNYNPPYIISEGLLEQLQALQPDIVEFHYRWAPSYTKELLRHPGPKVFTWHNSFGEGEGLLQRTGSWLNDRLFLPKLKAFDSVTCISDYVRQELLSRKVLDERMITIGNGVILPEVISGEEDDHILFVGRLVATKGLEYLMRALPATDANLVVCGKGPEMERLRALTVKLGIVDQVDFRGYVSEEERDRLLDRCQLYVMPSLFESFGIAAAEAMSHGKPVVCSEVGGLPEVVRDSGVLVPPRDPGALAEAINGLLQDDVRRRELGRKARAYSREYSWESVAAKTMNQYRSLV